MCLFHRNAGIQAAGKQEEPRRENELKKVETDWRTAISVVVREEKIRPHHADDICVDAIQKHGPIQNIFVAAKPALPQAVADHHYWSGIVDLIFSRREEASHQRLYAQRL